MLGGINAAQVYIVCGYTDLRRSIDGLAAIVKQNYGINPYNRSLFLFCGKRRDRIKGLLWDEDGFLLLYKRLNNSQVSRHKKAQFFRGSGYFVCSQYKASASLGVSILSVPCGLFVL